MRAFKEKSVLSRKSEDGIGRDSPQPPSRDDARQLALRQQKIQISYSGAQAHPKLQKKGRWRKEKAGAEAEAEGENANEEENYSVGPWHRKNEDRGDGLCVNTGAAREFLRNGRVFVEKVEEGKSSL